MNWTRLVAAFLVTSALGWAAGTTLAGKKSKKNPSETAASASYAGTVGDRRITLAEVDSRAKEISLEPFQALYDARRAALEAIVRDELFDREADEKGISRADYVAAEVDAKIEPLTDEAVEAFFQQNQAQMRGQSFEAMGPRIREFLEQQSRGTRLNGLVAELKTKYGVQVRLDAPRVEVQIAEEDPIKGPSDAPVRIVEFSDFECPYCSRVGPTMARIMEEYGDKVQVVFRDFPLPFHQKAHVAAQAAQCANDQGKFWEYHDMLFANQQNLDPASLKGFAAELGLNEESFSQCLDDGVHSAEVDEDHQYGQRLGVSGTPAFFINGRFLNGAQPFEAFAQIIDEELAATN